MPSKYHLIVACPDQCGIVAAVSTFIADNKGLVLEADHHTDLETNWFFMRYEIDAQSLAVSFDAFKQQFSAIARRFSMEYQIVDDNVPKRVLILASKQTHCVEDLLYRWQAQEMHCDVVGVVSNHNDLKERTQWYQLPFHYVPTQQHNKQEQFDKIAAIIEDQRVDLIVLARYMQILPEAICKKYPGKIINIHHSFLPSFIGADPYRQAYSRGVKLLGATSHYVTCDLDEGPIIEQDVVRINHRQSLKDYIRMGKDVERNVLARGIKAHLEDRIIIHGNKTIVFA